MPAIENMQQGDRIGTAIALLVLGGLSGVAVEKFASSSKGEFHLPVEIPAELVGSQADLTNPQSIVNALNKDRHEEDKITLNGAPEQPLFTYTVMENGHSRSASFTVADCKGMGVVIEAVEKHFGEPNKPLLPPSSIHFTDLVQRKRGEPEKGK